MRGSNEKEPLARIKKNCASLPPCIKTLGNHTKRDQYVARIWKRDDQLDPTGGSSPADYGWKLSENGFEPEWYPSSLVPDSLTHQPTSTDDRSRPGPATVDDERGSDDDSDWSKEEQGPE